MTCEQIALNLISRLDGHKCDGLIFSSLVIRAIKNITAKIKTREQALSFLFNTREYKKIKEEILPISVYVLSKYSVQRQVAIKWESGNQHYDAIAYNQIYTVDKIVKSKIYLEVTVVQHKNAYLSNEEVFKKGFSNGPFDIRRLPNGEIKSEPVAFLANEDIDLMIDSCCNGILKKEKNPYYEMNTILIVKCIFPNIIFFDEWAHFENGVKARIEPQKFQSIFVYADSFEWKFEINRKEK